ncbi:MAG: hypothetical protein JXB05_14525 [Myxococcaceae bacterium]|nr:hypothetical protein [Myxococcaceae bacterium]
MSEARALADKLREVQEELRQTRAQLDKQRAQHVREQAALEKALEQTRKEATRLRARLDQAAGRRWMPSGPIEPAQAPLPDAVAQVIVALARPPLSVEEALPALSRLLRLSPADVRMRLALPRPSILARLPALEAEMLRDLLIAEGFSAVLGEVPQMGRGLMQVRRFTLDERTLTVESAKGERQQARYAELRLLVRGRRKTTTVETQQEEYYDPVRRRRVKEEVKLKEDHVELFLWVYGGGMTAAITEGTSMVGLGALRAATKFATLQILTEELRKRAPQAVFDDRFLRLHLSLPLVGPERSQEVLAGLMYQAIQEGMWP